MAICKKSGQHFLTGILLLTVLLFLQCNRSAAPAGMAGKEKYSWTEFVMGVDLSYVNQVQDYGGIYKDGGEIRDPFLVFRDHGANTVRVRLWHDPRWQAALNNGRIYNDLADVTRTMQRAKAAGMAVNLDIHYSDTWADPAHQEIPAAWAHLSFETLKDSVYRYTLGVLTHLKNRGLVPEMVQVGNENNGGILFPGGQVRAGNWAAFGTLLNSGIRAVRDFSATSTLKPRIILHVAQLQNAGPWVDSLSRFGGVTDYDIIGISHYPKWSTITAMSEVSAVIRSLVNTWKKQVMIVETAYPWTGQNADSYPNIISGADQFGDYTISREGQLRFLEDLTRQIIEGGGSGIMYWEPAWISSGLRDRWGRGSSWENNALFDFEGNVLPGIDFMRRKYKLPGK